MSSRGPSESPARDPLHRVRRITTCLLAGVVLLGIGSLLFTTFWGGSALPLLDRDSFEQARQNWKDAQVHDYDIQVEVTGRQAAVYRVEVRGGEVIQATRDNHPLRQMRTLGTWSVPGMFSTMEADLIHMEKLAAGQFDPYTPQVSVRVRFDPQYGFPRHYHRTEMVKRRSNPEVSWKVVAFDIRDEQ